MTEPLRTCTHIHDTGRTCNSVAAKNQKYCTYHLHYRARQLRLAQARARAERFDIKLPPLEDMYAVQSALSQLAEALAAGMIDPRPAHALLSVLRLMSLNFRHPEKWQTNLYHSDQPASIDVAKEFGLPNDLDLDTPPEVAFPSSPDLSSRAQPSGVEGPAFPDSRPPTTDNWIDLPPMPHSGNYCGDHHSKNCDCTIIRADYPVTPEDVEIVEITETCGSDAAARRSKQLDRNWERRQLNRDRKRYAAIALEHNMRRAADRMAEGKLAERAKPEDLAAKKPPVSATSEASEVVAGKEATTA